jgi:ankyrin repeat protein
MPLQAAIDANDVEAVRLLLLLRQRFLHSRQPCACGGAENETLCPSLLTSSRRVQFALLYACGCDRTEIVGHMLDAGMDSNGAAEDAPALTGDSEDALAGPFGGGVGGLRKSPLIAACAGDGEATAFLLLSQGADAAQRDSTGYTALHGAASRGKLALVRALVETHGAEVNARTYANITLVDAACGDGEPNVEVVRFLIDSGAVVVETPVEADAIAGAGAGAIGILALSSACYRGLTDVVRLLLERQANPNSCPGDMQPLHYAAQYNYAAIVDLLITIGHANVEAVVSSSGDRPLHSAVAPFGDESVRWLLAAGACVDPPDVNGMTPLMRACESGNLPACVALIEAGADVNAKTSDGNTPLLVACGRIQYDIVTLLIKHGADVKAVGPYDRTPLDPLFPDMVECIRAAVGSLRPNNQG